MLLKLWFSWKKTTTCWMGVGDVAEAPEPEASSAAVVPTTTARVAKSASRRRIGLLWTLVSLRGNRQLGHGPLRAGYRSVTRRPPRSAAWDHSDLGPEVLKDGRRRPSAHTQ